MADPKVVIEKDGVKRTIVISTRHTFTKNELILAEKETQCSICLSDQEDQTYLTLECGHFYHTGCIIKWLSADEDHGCPTCRHQKPELKTRDDCIWLHQALFNITKTTQDPDRQCCICRNSLEDDRWFELTCNHMYHHLCFKTWINKRNVCPLDNRSPVYQ